MGSEEAPRYSDVTRAVWTGDLVSGGVQGLLQGELALLASDRSLAAAAAAHFDRRLARPDGDERADLVGRHAPEDLESVPSRLIVAGPAAAAARKRQRRASR